MSWVVLAVFSVGNLITRAIGMFAVGNRVRPDARVARLIGLVPISVVAAVFAAQTLSSRDQIVFDSRILGVAAASLAVWRRAPMVLVVLVAAGVTAGARALGAP